jgi:hypothetical protein
LRLVATESVSLDVFFHEPGQWSGLFFNEEATQFTWVELQTKGAQLKRRSYGGFKVPVAA